MIIDFHTHTFPDSIAPAAIKKMQSMCHSHCFLSGTEKALSESANKAGISLNVVLPVATNPEKVSSLNEKLSPEIKNGLLYFGAMHPKAENIKRELKNLKSRGFRGIKIHPVYQGVNIDDDLYLKIFDICGSLDLTVVTHSGDDIGFPNAVNCSPEMVANAQNKVGEFKFVLAHMGGWKNWNEVSYLSAYKNIYLDTSFSLGNITPLADNYYSSEQLKLLSEKEFLKIVKDFSDNRILFGTDSPWTDQQAEIKKINALNLDDTARQNIFYKNAKNLLNL